MSPYVSDPPPAIPERLRSVDMPFSRLFQPRTTLTEVPKYREQAIDHFTKKWPSTTRDYWESAFTDKDRFYVDEVGILYHRTSEESLFVPLNSTSADFDGLDLDPGHVICEKAPARCGECGSNQLYVYNVEENFEARGKCVLCGFDAVVYSG